MADILLPLLMLYFLLSSVLISPSWIASLFSPPPLTSSPFFCSLLFFPSPLHPELGNNTLPTPYPVQFNSFQVGSIGMPVCKISVLQKRIEGNNRATLRIFKNILNKNIPFSVFSLSTHYLKLMYYYYLPSGTNSYLIYSYLFSHLNSFSLSHVNCLSWNEFVLSFMCVSVHIVLVLKIVIVCVCVSDEWLTWTARQQ